ncbi:hypothetical protein J6590_039979 [Homalodisca vitripennis]|nr:hypothetical protein J6590_004644 [Homalodisca vitripennis]KAG8326517.1 hypothetical protein J6590_039979 [Homalodisca vitripennis]
MWVFEEFRHGLGDPCVEVIVFARRCLNIQWDSMKGKSKAPRADPCGGHPSSPIPSFIKSTCRNWRVGRPLAVDRDQAAACGWRHELARCFHLAQ